MLKGINACRLRDCLPIMVGFKGRGNILSGRPVYCRNLQTSTIVHIPKMSKTNLDHAVHVRTGKIAQDEDIVNSEDSQISIAVSEIVSRIPLSAGLLKNLMCYLCEVGFSVDDGIAMVEKCPGISGRSRAQLLEVMMTFRQCKFSDEDIISILRSAPEHFLVHPPAIASRYSALRQNFSHKSLKYIFSNCPRIGLTNWNAIKEKMDYLGNVMKVPSHQIAQSRAFDIPLSEIKARHIFLERAGVYKTPDPKSRIPSTNHTLSDITDTDDDYFAVRIAGLTAEEYFVFQELLTISSEDSESDGSDKAF
ncbi:transcription termination factor 4, mitochondrial-like [Ischnura elegans]|uniref:transcription termination factor 4, mitochondrial-like n=1 Tax=Ischnura elegans TaxID=197161 RepID=UPI001ED8BC84|nr:transcription termination factor 4, mitochondrial-like [Ischnura elegans]